MYHKRCITSKLPVNSQLPVGRWTATGSDCSHDTWCERTGDNDNKAESILVSFWI